MLKYVIVQKMPHFEQLTDGSGLAVMRGAIEPKLLGDLLAETKRLFSGFHVSDHENTRGFDSPGSVETYHALPTSEELVRDFGFWALSRVLKIAGRWSTDIVSVNVQDPFASQRFHRDNGKDGPVALIYPEGKGSLEYRVNTTAADIRELQVEAGDIVKMANPTIFHRGVNRGSTLRRTLVAQRPLNLETAPRRYSL